MATANINNEKIVTCSVVACSDAIRSEAADWTNYISRLRISLANECARDDDDDVVDNTLHRIQSFDIVFLRTQKKGNKQRRQVLERRRRHRKHNENLLGLKNWFSSFRSIFNAHFFLIFKLIHCVHLLVLRRKYVRFMLFAANGFLSNDDRRATAATQKNWNKMK